MLFTVLRPYMADYDKRMNETKKKVAEDRDAPGLLAVHSGRFSLMTAILFIRSIKIFNNLLKLLIFKVIFQFLKSAKSSRFSIALEWSKIGLALAGLYLSYFDFKASWGKVQSIQTVAKISERLCLFRIHELFNDKIKTENVVFCKKIKQRK